eukprot:scaffold2272_cov35-Cyclotella_meneghiniana.AAC.5
MQCTKASRHALRACIRRVLTSPDPCCEGAPAHISPARVCQKPWRHLRDGRNRPYLPNYWEFDLPPAATIRP